MKKIVWLFLFISSVAFSQKIDKANKKIITNLKTHITYLANDKLEGRRTGTPGEKLAYKYISHQFLKTGLIAKGDNQTFIQAFAVNEGKQINSSTHLSINENDLTIEKDFFPFIFSANDTVSAVASSILPTPKNTILFWDLKNILDENKNNPHFDLTDAIKSKANNLATNGALGLIVYNTSDIADELKFEPKAKSEVAKIPVIYLTSEAKKKYVSNDALPINIKLKVDIGDKKRTGHNVVGYIDNGAANTIIIGAHYDHLGYGEDHNSLYTGTTPQIHHGADDNASGTAALIELSKLLKTSNLKQNNYLIVAFSGEELGLFGSKYFAENPPINLSTINYMINMDMIGRLNDSIHGLNIGGYGTSPAWGQLLTKNDNYFKIKFDSSGVGPSDHTSFYRKDIPVLFFFTGTHSDYHKPSDVADKINFAGEVMVIKYIYNLIVQTNNQSKLVFTKTREAATTGKSSFKVTLGIMPDYTFSGNGVRVDGVSEGKTAQRVGIKAGDVITQLGNHKCSDVQTYMEALSKFKKGDATNVKVIRGNQEFVFDIIF